MAEKTLKDLFEDHLKDIYYAEKKILTAIPKMMKAAQSGELKTAFEKHLSQTEGQVQRLEEIFGLIDVKPKGKTCPAIDGILEEGGEVMKEYAKSPVIDAALIASAQAVEHYEITRYGTLKRWAENLGHSDAADLLDETLQEESQTDEDLSQLADNGSNEMVRQAAE
jgi:ferritin-like metal-binding protein YciE